MNPEPYFNAQDLCAFVKALKWIQVPEAVKDGIYVFNHPDLDWAQLVFPISERFRDNDEMLLRAASELAQIYDQDFSKTILLIEESNSEVLNARVPNPDNRRETTVSLLYASQVMEAHKKLWFSGAAANKERRAFYSTTPTNEAKTLMEAARFRHTEQGSFVFKTSCSLYALEGEGNIPLFSTEEVEFPAPFVRRAMLNIGTGLQNLVASIESRQEERLIDETKKGGASSVSANLCQAVNELRDEEHPHPIELSMSWSPLLPPPPDAPQGVIRIKTDYFPVIEQIGKELHPVRQQLRDTYVATVDELSGTFNNLFQREGRVLLTLLLAGGETVKVRVVLDPDKYDEAVAVHKTTTVYASVTGTIKPRQRQPYGFDLESFKIINAEAAPAQSTK